MHVGGPGWSASKCRQRARGVSAAESKAAAGYRLVGLAYLLADLTQASFCSHAGLTSDLPEVALPIGPLLGGLVAWDPDVCTYP